MRAEDLSKTLDHTVLAPGTTLTDIERACDQASRYHVAALCAFPYYTSVIAERLRTTDVKTCAVIAYPYGAEVSATKILAAERAVADGADELDVVMNVCAMRSGEFKLVRDELARLVHAVRSRAANDARGEVIVKVIVEAPLLDEPHLRLACKIVADAGVGTQATVSDVEIMRDALPEHVGVKASGGVRTVADVQSLVSAGAARIGTSYAVDVLEELVAINGGASR
jgi:deoxyribose-phosphate aldolase